MSHHISRSTTRQRVAVLIALALVGGGAMALPAQAKTPRPPLPGGSNTLHDHCTTGFTGSYTYSGNSFRVTVQEPTTNDTYVGGTLEIDVRTVNSKTGRVTRLKKEFDPITSGGSYPYDLTLGPNVHVWRLNVLALAPGALEDEHALDANPEPGCD